MNNVNLKRLLFILVISLITISIFQIYPGQNFLSFLFFTFVSNFFLLLTFNKNRIFIDFFLGLFLWLGFCYKYSISLLLGTGYFNEFLNGEILNVINDEVLNISSVAFIALIIARFIRTK